MSLKHGYCNKAMLKAMMSLLAVRKKGKLNKLYIRSYAHTFICVVQFCLYSFLFLRPSIP